LAIRDLDRSNKDLEEFAYVTSHDLQEPLRKITSFSTMLAARCSEELNDDGKLYIEKINNAAGNMRELIENLLQVSRTVQHSRPFVATDLNDILKAVKQDLDLTIEQGCVQIVQEPLPVLDALPPLVRQLFNNLLSNAIKFSSKNQTAIIHITSSEISSAEKSVLLLPNDKTYFKIAVKDNGIGFEQECAKDIFKIFFRLNNKTNYPGTGIGLSICNKIVEKHKGLLWAESEPGRGASFFIILPKTQGNNEHQ
jgi:light-regulated signal transduction histidine kinase (bacteriophytochrome)